MIKNKWFIANVLLCLVSSSVISLLLCNIYIFVILSIFNIAITSYNYKKGYFDAM